MEVTVKAAAATRKRKRDSHSPPLRTLKQYTVEEKLEIIKFAKSAGNRAAGREYNVAESSIREWRKHEDRLMDQMKGSSGSSSGSLASSSASISSFPSQSALSAAAKISKRFAHDKADLAQVIHVPLSHSLGSLLSLGLSSSASSDCSSPLTSVSSSSSPSSLLSSGDEFGAGALLASSGVISAVPPNPSVSSRRRKNALPKKLVFAEEDDF